MKDKIKDLFDNIVNRWKSLDNIQQRRLMMGTAGLVIAIGVTIFFATRPTWVTLARDLTFTESDAISRVLNEEGIRNQIALGGSLVEVREQDVARAEVLIHTNIDNFGETPRFTLENVLEQINLSTSEDTRQEMFRRAREGEIAQALTSIEGVEDANVTLTLADTRAMFLVEAQHSRASIVLTLSRPIDNQSALGLAAIVVASVEGLNLENVVILDQHMRSVFNGSAVGDDRFGGSILEEDLRTTRTAQVEHAARSALSGIFSQINVAATVTIDTRTANTVERTFADPAGTGAGFIRVEEVLAEMAEGTAPDFPEPGMGANDGFGTMGLGGNMGDTLATRDVHTREYIFNEIITETSHQPGELLPDQSNLAVTVFTDRLLTEPLARGMGLLGEDEDWEVYMAANAEPILMELDENIILLVSNATGIPVDNITVMGFERMIFLDLPTTPMDWRIIILLGVLAALLAMLAYGLIKSREPMVALDVEPELSVEDLLVSTRIEEAAEEERQSLQEIALNIDSEVKQQIDKFVSEKPEAVAQLLRSWMNEGWE